MRRGGIETACCGGMASLAPEASAEACSAEEGNRENIFYRDDYAGPDNKNWLKWIFVDKTENGAMRFATEPVPVERYRFQPT